MAEIIIETKNLIKDYHTGDITVRALNGINLDIHKGEFAAIMGASGSGKSTLMNILGCLDVPTSGDYFLDGVHVNKLSKNELADVRNLKIGTVASGAAFARRPVCCAAIRVEPDPPKRSKTFSPRFEEYSIARTPSSVGFSVR